MRKASFVGAVAIAASLLLATPAIAVGNPETFDGFDVESPLTSTNASDNGWQYTADQGARDVAIVANGIDGNSLRMSNAVTDSSFGNWLFSQRITPVQEDADGNKFIATYQIKSTSNSYQDSMNPNYDAVTNPDVPQRVPASVSVSPQSLDGARMSFLKFVDSNDGGGGIDVYFADFDNSGQNQRLVQIANNQPRGGFTVRTELDLYTGPNNDVAQVFINNGPGLIPMTGGDFTGFFAPVDNPDTANKVKAGQSVPMKWKLGALEPATTWEDYYRFNDESNEGHPNFPGGPYGTRAVDSLIFQARTSGGTAPDVAGGGFLFDNVSLTTGDVGTLPKGGAVGDPSVYGTPIFKSVTGPCGDVDDYDPLETADAPGASHLTYDAATGIWHYNWQTTKSMAGAGCVKLTLLATGDYALFKITK